MLAASAAQVLLLELVRQRGQHLLALLLGLLLPLLLALKQALKLAL
jgi:hypothetical protein